METIRKIIEQQRKAENACNKAEGECQKLAQLIAPYIHEEIRDDIGVLDQAGDGLVMEWEAHNYSVSDIITAIRYGERDIDMRDDYHCPITAI